MEKYDAGLRIIATAQQAREAGDYVQAHEQFIQGIEELMRLVQNEGDAETKTLVRKHCARFMDEAEQILTAQPSPTAKLLQAKAQGLEERAKKEQQQLKFAAGLALYTEACEAYKLLRQASLGKQREWAGERALSMLEKAEHLQTLVRKIAANGPKGVERGSGGSSHAGGADSGFDNPLGLPHAVGASGFGGDGPANFARPDQVDSGTLPNSLTWLLARGTKTNEEEERVLVLGSTIHGRRIDRFYEVDTAPHNFEGQTFQDQEQPHLSKHQKSVCAVWGRPDQVMGPSFGVIKEISHVGIKQGHGLCNFVASLGVCAAWERRFGRTLISRNIFPQRGGVPILSQSGKYAVKMYLNGSVRGITIDDHLPVTRDKEETRLLCSHTSAGDELWVSLFEKAYAKLHGGYDFPGTSSAIDLHMLCGWIPEDFSFCPALPPRPPPCLSQDNAPPPPAQGRSPSILAPSTDDSVDVAVVAAAIVDEDGVDAEDVVTASAVIPADVLPPPNVDASVANPSKSIPPTGPPLPDVEKDCQESDGGQDIRKGSVQAQTNGGNNHHTEARRAEDMILTETLSDVDKTDNNDAQEASVHAREYEEAVAAGQQAREVFWTRMKLAQAKGTALFTLRTRALTEEEETGAGLISHHAYAVLRVEDLSCRGTGGLQPSPRVASGTLADADATPGRRLVQLKNACTNVSWKGYYAASDDQNWSGEVLQTLGYTNRDDLAEEEKNGMFWMSWEDILVFFTGISSSWSPARFTFRRDIHALWQRTAAMPNHLDDNPQYILRVSAAVDTVVWLVLFQHYSGSALKQGQGSSAGLKLALHTFKGNRKAYQIAEEAVKAPWKVPYTERFVSARLTCPKGDQAFVVVVAADQAQASLAYTLTSFSTEPAALYSALDCPAVESVPTPGPGSSELPRSFTKTFRYKWTAESAGGSRDAATFEKNPMFRLDSAIPQRVFVKVRCDACSAVFVHVFASGERVQGQEPEAKAVSGHTSYRAFVAWREYDLQAGYSTLVAASTDGDGAGVVAEFTITLKARTPVHVSSLPYSRLPAPPPPTAAVVSADFQGPIEAPPAAATGVQPCVQPDGGHHPGMISGESANGQPSAGFPHSTEDTPAYTLLPQPLPAQDPDTNIELDGIGGSLLPGSPREDKRVVDVADDPLDAEVGTGNHEAATTQEEDEATTAAVAAEQTARQTVRSETQEELGKDQAVAEVAGHARLIAETERRRADKEEAMQEEKHGTQDAVRNGAAEEESHHHHHTRVANANVAETVVEGTETGIAATTAESDQGDCGNDVAAHLAGTEAAPRARAEEKAPGTDIKEVDLAGDPKAESAP